MTEAKWPPPVSARSFTTDVLITKQAAEDGLLTFEVYDVDSGFNEVQDTILWDSQLVKILESTTPEKPGNGSPSWVDLTFHSQSASLAKELISPGVHTIEFVSGPDSINDRPRFDQFDDYMFKNVQLQYEPVPEPSTLTLVAMGMVGVLALRSRRWFC